MFHLRGVRTLVRHRRASAVVFSIALFCAVWASTWRPTAQNQNLPRPNAVERFDAAAPVRPLNPSDRGATYRWLDERAVRVTTTFVDAVVITERVPGGDLRTRIRDIAGRELGEFTVDRVGAGDDVLTFKRAGEQVVRTAGKPNGPLTLDWSNRQAYAIWKDDPANPAIPLEWQGDVIRARGGRSLDFRRDTLEVRTEWFDGFAAKASRAAGRRPNPKTGVPSRGLTFESQLARDNVEVGRSRWYPEEQVYVWSVPGLTTGYLDAERMKDAGGWTLTPDSAWANVQTYAFHYFHTLMATQGFVADARPAGNRRPWLARLVDVVAPTVHANEPGCDGLHWLDTTILPAVLRCARPLLREERLHVEILVGVLERLEVRGMQHRRSDLHPFPVPAVLAGISIGATKGELLSLDTRASGYFLAGAVAFAAAQAVLFLVADPPARDAIDGKGWFLNSSTGIAVMATVLVAASLVVSRALPAPLWQRWVLFVAGGVAALVGAVFLLGPGTIFPIVIVAGAAVIAVSALVGVWGARLLG